MERKPLEKIVRDRNTRMNLWLFVPIFAVYLIIQALLFYFSLEAAKKSVLDWKKQYQDRVTQDLFLQNQLDLKDLVRSTQYESYRDMLTIQFTILDHKRRPLLSTDRNSSEKNWVEEKVGTHILFKQGQVSDFTELRLGDNKLGYLWVGSQYPWMQLLMQSGWVFGTSVLLFVFLKLGVMFLVGFLKKSVVTPLQKISSEFETDRSQLEQWSPIPMELEEFQTAPREIISLVRSYNRLLDRIKRLRDKEKQLVINQAKLDLASQVAHDIRSPMAALSLAIESSEGLSDKTKEIFVNVVKRMTEISQELLAEETATKGGNVEDKNLMNLEKVKLKEVVHAMVGEKKLLLAERQEVKISAGEFSEIKVWAEEKAMRRVLSNLIDNAIEAIDGPGEISFKVTVTGGICYFSVKDTGKGIEKERISRVWEPGYTHGKKNGNGLGLSFVRQQVESWGGRAVIDSAPGKGTVISLQLKVVHE